MRSILVTAAVGLVVVVSPRMGVAGTCSGSINRANVAACALEASPELVEQLAAVRAAVGRREAARPFLPSNPTISAGVSRRRVDALRDTNWSLTLGQQVEVGGQRGLRMEVADHELRAGDQRLLATRIRIAAEAWNGYFAVLATHERLSLARRLESATGEVATTVRAMAANGVASEVDADIADAAALRVTQDRLALEGALVADRAQLAVLTGEPAAEVEGALEPLPAVSVPQVMPTRPEVLALGEDQAALVSRGVLLKRERVPSPTFSLMAQDDGFNERVLGIGVTLPIPLPQPIGRTNAGEIAEAAARADELTATRDVTTRRLSAELSSASADYDSASKARALYTEERVQRVLTRLESITAQVKAGRLAVRDALIAQQALVDQLKSAIDAREWLCLASVRLSRAAGASLEGGAQ